MLLGERLSKGAARPLWKCTAVVDHSHQLPPGLGKNWPPELVCFLAMLLPHIAAMETPAGGVTL